MVTIKPGTPIKRKDDIPASERTEKRDNTAEVLEEHWHDPDWTKTDIAEVADASRTHVDTVLEKYFEPVNPNEQTVNTAQMSIKNLEGVLNSEMGPTALKLYLQGYTDALEDFTDEGAEQPDVSDFFRGVVSA